MAKVDPRDFLLNTDYEMDKIVFFMEGSVDAGAYNLDIPHKLPFTPLIFGVCAFNDDFSDARSVPYQYLGRDNTIQFIARANATNVRLDFTYYAGPVKINYRLYGFEPSDSHAKIGATSKYAKQFILNTDYNYCKLYKKGTANAGDTITHNLGYMPQVLAWQQSNGWVEPVEMSTTTPASGMYVTNTDVVFQFQQLGIDKLHYRIYYDEA